MIPQNFKQENVSSTLSSDGILTISAAAPAIQSTPNEDLRSVKITSVGPQKDSVQGKAGKQVQEETSQPKIEQVN